MYPTKKRNLAKKLVITLVILALIGGAGYAGWWWFQQDADDNDTEEIDETQQEPEPVEVEIEEYSSDDPALSFSYPSNWTVREDEEEGTILVVSPSITYQTVDGASVDGHFRIFLRQTSRDEDATYIGRGVAALPSETLTYSNPSMNQREETSISFFGINDSDNFGFFFIAGNFTLAPGDILGGDYGREEGTYIIGGGYSSDELTEDLATNPVPLSEYDEHEVYQQAIEIIESIRIG